MAFEFSGKRHQFCRCFFLLKIGATLKCFLHLCKIRWIVGAQINDPIRCKDAVSQRREVGIDQPMSGVFVLGPRVGKINVYGLEGMLGQEVFQHVSGFDAE